MSAGGAPRPPTTAAFAFDLNSNMRLEFGPSIRAATARPNPSFTHSGKVAVPAFAEIRATATSFEVAACRSASVGFAPTSTPLTMYGSSPLRE